MKKIVLSFMLAGLLTITACSAGGEKEFTYSSGINKDGYWDKITATEHVELADLESIEVPAEIHQVSSEALDAQIQAVLAYFTTEAPITDRPIVTGDKVNIDYVGTVDGVAFEGGDTAGKGTDVIIGETQYIEGFLDQLIGINPGQTFDILVTFPEDYGVEELNGKAAVFHTTVNFISVSVTPTQTDAFVAENLQESHGWATVKDMEDGLREELQKAAIMLYVQDYIVQNTKVLDTPKSMFTYQENAMIQFYTEYAKNSNMELGEFLSAYVGVESTEALLENSVEDNTKMANYYLILQAIAENKQIQVTDEDISTYFKEYMEPDDHSELETYYGLPFIKMTVLQQKVLDLLVKQTKLV